MTSIERNRSSAPANPFDDEDADFLVLVNHEGQHSLWPTFASVPDGWTVTHDAAPRARALEYVEQNWTDMRPLSLVRSMERAAEQRRSQGRPVGRRMAGG